MNRDRFIERLNLYLDGELSANDAEELLSAARGNPELSRIFRQYCQINKACAALGESFAPTPEARSQWRQRIYAMGGMAAAVALLGLAAQNLAPMMGSADDQPAFAVSDRSIALPQAPPSQGRSDAVLVSSAARPEGPSNVPTIQVKNFDFGNAFQPLDKKALATPKMSLASFVVDQPEAAVESSSWKPNFSLGQPVSASTFEHELASSKEGQLETLAGAVYESPVLRAGDATLRFDVNRAQAVPLHGPEPQAGVTAGAGQE